MYIIGKMASAKKVQHKYRGNDFVVCHSYGEETAHKSGFTKEYLFGNGAPAVTEVHEYQGKGFTVFHGGTTVSRRGVIWRGSSAADPVKMQGGGEKKPTEHVTKHPLVSKLAKWETPETTGTERQAELSLANNKLVLIESFKSFILNKHEQHVNVQQKLENVTCKKETPNRETYTGIPGLETPIPRSNESIHIQLNGACYISKRVIGFSTFMLALNSIYNNQVLNVNMTNGPSEALEKVPEYTTNELNDKEETSVKQEKTKSPLEAPASKAEKQEKSDEDTYVIKHIYTEHKDIEKSTVKKMTARTYPYEPSKRTSDDRFSISLKDTTVEPAEHHY